MVRIAGDILINRPVETVFDLVVDERNEPLYNPDLLHSEKLTDGPVGVGTQFRATHRQGKGEVDMLVEVTSCDRPHRMATRITMDWSDINGELIFEPVGRETKMRWEWDVRPKGALKALPPVVRFMGQRSERACWEGLKRYLEDGQDSL